MRENTGYVGSPSDNKRASEIVFENLRERILNGEFKPGDKLPSERMMMEEYGRSHPTIREAVRKLEGAGMVDVVHGSGIIVRKQNFEAVKKPLTDLLRFSRITTDEMKAFFRATEPEYMAMAAEIHQPEDETDLLDCFNQMRKAQASPANFFQKVKQFHIRMIHSLRNPLLSLTWESIYGMTELKRIPKELYGEFARITEKHHRILKSFAEGDAALVKRYVSEVWQAMDGLSPYVKVTQNRNSNGARRKRASEVVFEELRRGILEGQLQPGTKLPSERKLMTVFNKSRPVIREALKMLETQGYVLTSRGSGTMVKDLSPEGVESALVYLVDDHQVTLRNFMDFRAGIEPVAARWAAEARDESDLRALEDVVGEAEIRIASPETLVHFENEFNETVAEACGNRIIATLSPVASQLTRIQVARVPAESQKGGYPEAVIRHRELLQWIRDRDSESAENAVRDYVTRLRKELTAG